MDKRNLSPGASSSSSSFFHQNKYLRGLQAIFYPTSYWWINAITLGSFVFILQLIAFPLMGGDAGAASGDESESIRRSFIGALVSMLILSPLIETCFIALLYKIAFRSAGPILYVIFNLLLSNMIHFLLERPVDPIIVTTGFAVMAVQYAFLRATHGGLIAYVGTCVTHSVYNLELVLLAFILFYLQ